MVFLAGIVRLDGEIVPDAWAQSLIASATEKIRAVSIGHGGSLLLAPEGGIVEAPDGRIDICHARLDDRVVGRARAKFTTNNDAAFVSQGLQRFGEEWVEELIGDFTLAAWHPEHNRLSLTRSLLTAGPIYFVVQDDVFAFASKASSLLALPFVTDELNEAAICRTLCFDGRAPLDETFYSAIRRLPAAHRMTVENGRISVKPIPALWPEVSTKAPIKAIPVVETTNDPAERIRSLLIEAVECRIDPGKTIAVHLSGGLDSSAIACIAARRLKLEGRRLIALCSVLPCDHVGPETDERSFIEKVLAQEDNIDPVWVEASSDEDPFSALPCWFAHLQEPPYSNVTHVDTQLGEAGRAHGVNIVLSGFGGDFFVSARFEPSSRELLSAGRWVGAAAHLFRRHRSFWKAPPRYIRDSLRSLLSGGWPPAHEEANTGAAFADLVDRIEKREGRRPKSSLAPRIPRSLHESMRFVLEPGRLERAIPHTTQFYLEQFHQDIRYPLLDLRLIAAVMGLEESEIRRGGQSRGLMRRAMTGILPEEIRQRPDKGPAFDPALAAHCVTAGPALRRWIEAASPKCWEYVDKEKILATLDKVGPSNRDGWRADMFAVLLTGVRIAKFVDWRLRGPEATFEIE